MAKCSGSKSTVTITPEQHITRELIECPVCHKNVGCVPDYERSKVDPPGEGQHWAWLKEHQR